MKRTEAQVIEALTACSGNFTQAAKKLDVSRRHVQDWYATSAAVREATAQCMNVTLDLCISNMTKGIREGDFSWTRLWLQYSGQMAAMKIQFTDERESALAELTALSNAELDAAEQSSDTVH